MRVLTVVVSGVLAWFAAGTSVQAAQAGATADCAPQGGLSYLCGPRGAEDMARIEGTPWLVATGLAEGTVPGQLHLVHVADRSWEPVVLGRNLRITPDVRRFPDCTTPPDPAVFSAHGLSVRSTGSGRHALLVVNHGGREAIEFYEISSRGQRPSLSWIGCVRMPPDVSVNSVARLPDGGFVATQFYAPSQGGMGAILRGQLTGGVLEWHPGGAVQVLAGTSLVGANGIEMRHRGKVLYVAAWGARQLVRFDRRGASLVKTSIPLDFAPDNLRWMHDGQLLVAGQRFSVPASGPLKLDGWQVSRVDPESLAVTPLFTGGAELSLQGVSVAIEAEGQLWVGPFRGDRIASLPLPR